MFVPVIPGKDNGEDGTVIVIFVDEYAVFNAFTRPFMGKTLASTGMKFLAVALAMFNARLRLDDWLGEHGEA